MLGPVRRINLAEVELARGYFEKLKLVEGTLLIGGWLLLPTRPLSSLRAYVDGENVGFADVEKRADVANAFPWIAHAKNSGFRFKIALQGIGEETLMRINVLGFHGNRPAG